MFAPIQRALIHGMQRTPFHQKSMDHYRGLIRGDVRDAFRLGFTRPTRRKIAEAASRYRNSTDYLNASVWDIPERVLFWASLFIAINLDPYQQEQHAITPVLLAFMAGFLMALLALSNSEHLRFPLMAQTLRSRILLTALGGLAIYSIWEIIIEFSNQKIMLGGSNSSVDTTLRSVGSFILAFTALSYSTGKSIADRRLRARDCRPYDAVTLRTLRLAADMHESRESWPESRTVRQWVVELEDIATLATIDFTLPGRVSRADWQTWKQFRDEATRIAGVFRAHKIHVLRAQSSEDIEEVVESLKVGVLAMLEGDRARLLANAPEQVTERDPFVTLLRRATSGGIIILAGFLLPLLPIIAAHSAAAQSMRWTLLVAGVAMLISSSPEVSSRVNDAFGKAITGK